MMSLFGAGGVIQRIRAVLRLRTRLKSLASCFVGPSKFDHGKGSVETISKIGGWTRYPAPPRRIDLSRLGDIPSFPKEGGVNSVQGLSVDAYDTAEVEALKSVSIPSMMAFQPAAFQSVGYPVRVRTGAELLRYADHNFEAEVPGLYARGATFAPIGFVNAFTPSEAELIGRLRDVVAEMTEARFGRSVRPMTNLMVQLGPFRCIEALSEVYERRLAVFEPGPGVGYLGALLVQSGYSYSSYDVTQALYLWQSHLLDAVTHGNVVELANPNARADVDRLGVLHLPWWLFAHQMGDTQLRYDIVYSNSNLGEMTAIALRHLLLFSKTALRDSEVGCVNVF